MKTTSTITNKYTGHNTQKTAFPLCARPSDTPRRANANFRKMDNTTLQVDAVVNAKLADGYRLPAKYVIRTAGPVLYRGQKGKADFLASCSRCSHSFPSVSTSVYSYSLDQVAEMAVEPLRETLKAYLGVEKIPYCCFSDKDRVLSEKIFEGKLWRVKIALSEYMPKIKWCKEHK